MSRGGRDGARRRNPGRLARLVMVPALLALSAIWISTAGNQSTHRAVWANYDTDNWGGWSDTSNPGFVTNPQGCDPIDPAQCMLPYPNDWLTKPDPTSATGRRLNLDVLAMPRNIAGKPINPADYDRSDGFSAGSTLLTVVPGMTQNSDLAKSGLPTDLDMDVNANPCGMGVILLDTTDGTCWPVWAEIDQYTAEAGLLPAGAVGSVQQDLMIHPAKNLLDGHRYIVALRHLQTDSGSVAQPSAAFESYVRSFLSPATPSCAALGTVPVPSSDPRTGHMDRIFCDLQQQGWRVTSNSSDLYLAWDFTTASTQNVTGRLLAIRDDAFSQLGESQAQTGQGADPTGAVPSFQVSSSTDFQASDPSGTNYNTNIAREITGTFTVPCYIAPTCAAPIDCKSLSSSYPFDACPFPGSFYYTDPTNPDATPSQVPGQSYHAGFVCVVGRTGFSGHQLLRPVEYGHGLFGSDSEVTASPQEEMADRQGMLYCATDWFGWSNSDIPNALLALSDLSNFSVLADRGQQGELDFLYLQRLMIDPDGFSTSPDFQYSDGTSFIDVGDGVSYDGNSQGGIFGGTVCAVSIDARRCALGVNGMDYSTLLPRSVDYVASSTLTQFAAQNLMTFAASPTKYDPSELTGVGYSNAFDLFYPDQSQRQLILDLIQTLWDRADPDGYAGHMSASAEGGLLPDCTGEGVVPQAQQGGCPAGTPDHHVLMQIAWGDHQVANFTAFDEARTIGARAVGGPASSNTLAGGEALLASRLCNTDAQGAPTANDAVDGVYCYAADSPLWGVTPISSYPYNGSAIVVFDGGPDGVSPYGTDPPPPSDVPPPDTASNVDPHEAPRRTCAAQDMKGTFFDLFGRLSSSGGLVTDPVQQLSGGGTLAGPPYFSGGWQGTCALP